jgi:hypothetical protein
VPDAKRGTVKYLRTPGDLWDAQCVFLDEISRCRPETQNKLFSVIHEKRVQGLALPKLRYRWAAMNPPLTADSDPDRASRARCTGCALADPSYVVELPALTIAPADRIALISRSGGATSLPTSVRWSQGRAKSRRRLSLIASGPQVRQALVTVGNRKLAISGRRGDAGRRLSRLYGPSRGAISNSRIARSRRCGRHAAAGAGPRRSSGQAHCDPSGRGAGVRGGGGFGRG